MKNEFKKILNLLIKLNKNFASQKIRSAPIQKENRRLKRLDNLDYKVIQSLNLLKKSSFMPIDTVMEQICYLNIYLDSYAYHIKSIQDLIEKLVHKDLRND